MHKTKNNLPVISEEEIIKKILEGETALFEVLIRRHDGVLYKIARGYGFNHQDAEDLMQETHVKAFEELPKLQHPASYKTWISKIMIHKCNYKLKHGYFKKEKPQDETINAKYDTIYSGKEMMQTENRLQDANFLKCWNQVFKIFHSITELCSF